MALSRLYGYVAVISHLHPDKTCGEKGTRPHPKKFELLSRLPDYSFTDGRPTPLSFRQQIKLLTQQKYCKKIVELSHELDVGLENYYKKQEEIVKYKETILKNKLKPKGKALLDQNKVKS